MLGRRMLGTKERKYVKAKRLKTTWGILGTGNMMSGEGAKRLEKQALSVSWVRSLEGFI